MNKLLPLIIWLSACVMRNGGEPTDFLSLLHQYYDILIDEPAPPHSYDFQNSTQNSTNQNSLNLLSPPCKSDLRSFLLALLLSPSPWARAMLDASGKIPAGLMGGNLFAFGSYDQCLNASTFWTGHNDSHAPMPWFARSRTAPAYCSIALDVSRSVWGAAASTRFAAWSTARAFAPIFYRVPGQYYYHGSCLPAACSPLDVALLAEFVAARAWSVLSFANRRHGTNPLDRPLVARVACFDSTNKTITWWSAPVPASGTPNATIPIIPAIYDPSQQVKTAERRKRIDTIVGVLAFGTAFLTLAAALFWDRVLPECRKRLVTLRPSEQDTDILLATDSRRTESTHHHPIERHARNLTACLSPLRNMTLLLKRDETVADFLPLRPTDDDNANASEFSRSLDSAIPAFRACSLLWLMCAQVYALAPAYTANAADMERQSTTIPFLTLNGATFAIDTFLFVSGLAAASALARPNRALNGALSWVSAYVYRFARFTPLYAAVITYVVTFGPYIGSGPFWLSQAQPDQGLDCNCRSNWWTNLLYINNFVRSAQACLPWTWFLAIEAQFFLFAPLLISLFKRSPTLGTVVVAHFMVATISASFALSYVNRYRATFSLYDPLLAPYFYDYYIRPYVRMAPYLIGLLFGCYVYHFSQDSAALYDEDREFGPVPGLENVITWSKLRRGWFRVGRAHTSNRAKRAAAWAIWLSLIATLVYVLRYDLLTLDYPPDGFTRLGAAFYNSLSHAAWAIGLIGILWLLHNGKSTSLIIKAKCWIPISNLTYAAYLVHPLVVLTLYQCLRVALYFTHTHFALACIVLSGLTLVIAIPLTLTFEIPIINLARIYGSRLMTEASE